MNELLVMRHAKSDWSTNEADFDRPLNARGYQAAEKMAHWLCDQGLCPDRIISSPAMRTRSTVLAVVTACGTDKRELEFDRDLYLADAFTWLQVLSSEPPGRLLICGHNPGLDDLVDFLASTPPTLSGSGKLMTTAAIAHFRCPAFGELSRGGSELVQLVRPR